MRALAPNGRGHVYNKGMPFLHAACNHEKRLR